MPSSSSRSATTSKPYDRPSAGSGAPAQLSQSSRKGKKAWRKNVDLRAEEEALEQARAEERVTGGKVADKQNNDLFTIDTTGDVEASAVKRKVKAKKPLRSLAVLQERSAVPSLTARTAAPAKIITAKEKNRMRRIARRTIDATSSADVHKTDTSELTDAWESKAAPPTPAGGFGAEGMFTPKVKAPITIARQRAIRYEAIQSQRADELPVTGTSYNPAAEAHAALIGEAVEEELGRLGAEKKAEDEVAVLGQVVDSRRATERVNTDDFVDGMKVGRGDGVADDEDEDASDPDAPAPKKPTKRKTQAQRNKALRARAAAQAAKDEKIRKKLERETAAAKLFSKTAEERRQAAEDAAKLRKVAAAQRERLGFTGGEKIGKHRVAKGAVTVQLGEDLAESLRQVKPEGNLFKDRFLSLQRRALLEPRVPQLPKRKVGRTKEYEKHAWKKFE
ncbi:hypothetical protein VHUM_03938 [Vanrija humicola]|uniref:Ribosome biogenesis protein NOP53 n=1 Tax=Vanrija humicola TaxID=5417 RepID=A0A7D8UWC0_VANHU|nr:hypothetical protein VHUM_03938 [Vanrija humicola]